MARTDDVSIIELVKQYAAQETLGKLKGARRWLAFGAAGAVLLGLGLMLLLLGGLRFVQTEFDTTFDGRVELGAVRARRARRPRSCWHWRSAV